MSNHLLTLHRTVEFGGECTLGGLFEGDRPLCRTLEKPWVANTPYESCIPTGIYRVVPHQSPTFGKCFTLLDDEVHPRTHILVHVGNRGRNTKGCILVGDSFGRIEGEHAVLNSKDTLLKLMSAYPAGFILRITNKTLARIV